MLHKNVECLKNIFLHALVATQFFNDFLTMGDQLSFRRDVRARTSFLHFSEVRAQSSLGIDKFLQIKQFGGLFF